MRQTYFRDNEIKFSRLTPVDLPRGRRWATMIAEETTRTWQYLDSLRNFGPTTASRSAWWCTASDRPRSQPDLRDFAQIQYRVLDIEQVVDEAGTQARARWTPPPKS